MPDAAPVSLTTPLALPGGPTFPVRAVLAPMEGVTDRVFRRLVLGLGHAGGATTEFLRISVAPVPVRVIRRELGPPERVPVGVQLMAPGPEHVPASVANAERAGADWIDLNFGCPVKTVCGKGAGAALLDEPETIGRIVAVANDATRRPVSAKIRAGTSDASRLDEVVDAAAEAGAAMVTLHARTRADSYAAPANWEWIARAAARLDRHGVPLIGNGGVETAEDAARMLNDTGCAAVMIGRAAIADPFLFGAIRGGPPATPNEARAFVLRYLDAMLASARRPTAALGRLKQLLRVYRAGDLFAGREHERQSLLRATDVDTFRRFLGATGA